MEQVFGLMLQRTACPRPHVLIQNVSVPSKHPERTYHGIDPDQDGEADAGMEFTVSIERGSEVFGGKDQEALSLWRERISFLLSD